MPKVRKLKRKKKFRVNVNRKRLRNKMNKLPNIECKEIKEAWVGRASIAKNLTQMGLAHDPNKVLGIPNVKKKMLDYVGRVKVKGECDIEEVPKKKKIKPKKGNVAEILETEAKWPRARLFRLPNNEVQFATYMMDKHGDDYKAMERDRKNFYQLTSCQIKQKIQKFKSIPEQYAEYLVKKGEITLEEPVPLKKIKPQDLIVNQAKKNPESKKKLRRKRNKSTILEDAKKEAEDDVDFDTSKTLDDSEVLDSANGKLQGETKLKLFSDEENDSEDEMGNDLVDNNGSVNSDDNDSEDEEIKNNKTTKIISTVNGNNSPSFKKNEKNKPICDNDFNKVTKKNIEKSNRKVKTKFSTNCVTKQKSKKLKVR